MKILHLTIKKKWFDMIFHLDPEKRKKEEYREIKKYWISRFCDSYTYLGDGKGVLPNDKDSYWYSFYPISLANFDAVRFTNGYSKTSPTGLVELKKINIGETRSEWSDNWKGNVFRIHLGEIIEMPKS